jgi:hypothetical protein
MLVIWPALLMVHRKIESMNSAVNKSRTLQLCKVTMKTTFEIDTAFMSSSFTLHHMSSNPSYTHSRLFTPISALKTLNTHLSSPSPHGHHALSLISPSLSLFDRNKSASTFSDLSPIGLSTTRSSFTDTDSPYSAANSPFSSSYPASVPFVQDTEYLSALSRASHEDLVRSGNPTFQQLQLFLSDLRNAYNTVSSKAAAAEEKVEKLQWV